MGAQIPVIAERPLSVCGCKKLHLDSLGDHLCTCTTHSGPKKTHDWVVDQITDLFPRGTTHKVKTQQVTTSRGQQCGDIELADYLARHLHYPNDIDRSLNEAVADKIRKYRTDIIKIPLT
jgi:hypothetical protein